MKCFIHLNKDSSTYCSVCKRPICISCAKVENSVCPRCANFTHSTIFNYNKRILLFLMIICFIRLTFFYDVIVLTISSNGLLPYTSTGVLVLIASFIPFCVNVIRYGFKNAIRYQCFGKTSAIEIADDKKWKSVKTYFQGILSFVICGALYLIITPVFVITDFMHLVKSIKDVFYHKKRILSETQINNLN